MSENHVLMLSYYYPPINVVGAFRSVGFSRHLAEMGWDVTVLTVEECRDPWTPGRGGEVPPGVRVVRTLDRDLFSWVDRADALLGKLLSFLRRKPSQGFFRDLAIPDPQIWWQCESEFERLARAADVIYVSCSPFSSAVMAARLRSKIRKPVIVDFRDAWTLSPYAQRSRFHRWRIERLERFVLEKCDRLILNTPGAEKLYSERYPELRHKFCCIPNGYDEVLTVSEIAPDPFRIVHAGSLFGNRHPRNILRALSELYNSNIVFVNVGNSLPGGEEFRSSVRIELHPYAERSEVFRLLQGASLLYLRNETEGMDRPQIAVAAKTYEYLTTGIPILAEITEGDNADLLRQYGTNARIITDPAGVGLREAVEAFYNERRSAVPQISEGFLQEFSRKALTRRLVEEFEKCIASIG